MYEMCETGIISHTLVWPNQTNSQHIWISVVESECIHEINMNTSTLTTKLLFAYITVVLFDKTEIRSKIPKVYLI